MKLRKVLRRKTLLVLLPALIGLTGCSGMRSVTLHPIEQSHFFEMKAGESYTPEQNGYFLSEYYLEEVARARVGK